jgi:hypothetical protein
VASALRLHVSQVVVRTEDEPLETDRTVTQPSGKALLDQEYEKTEKVDANANLAAAHKEHKSKKFDFAAKSEVKASSGPDFASVKSSSPLGSTKAKLPKVTSAAR